MTRNPITNAITIGHNKRRGIPLSYGERVNTYGLRFCPYGQARPLKGNAP